MRRFTLRRMLISTAIIAVGFVPLGWSTPHTRFVVYLGAPFVGAGIGYLFKRPVLGAVIGSLIGLPLLAAGFHSAQVEWDHRWLGM